MVEQWKVRVYENGKHMHICNYSNAALSMLSAAALEVLERKDIRMKVDSDGSDILLEYPETLPPSLIGTLVRIRPANCMQKNWSEYVQLHFINPGLYSKYYQRPLHRILTA